jgi:hypothetical protein
MTAAFREPWNSIQGSQPNFTGRASLRLRFFELANSGDLCFRNCLGKPANSQPLLDRI